MRAKLAQIEVEADRIQRIVAGAPLDIKPGVARAIHHVFLILQLLREIVEEIETLKGKNL